MKKMVVVSLLVSLSSGAAYANCVGTSTYSNCYDYQSGNSYSVNRSGDSTYMNGYNSRTGSSWSQQSHDFGNTTQTYGRDSRGRSWSRTCVNGNCF